MTTENKPLLVKLSEACQRHRIHHHPNGEDDVSGECQRDLEALSMVIPKVEAEYLRSAEIIHLCDFYNDVIHGGFCPHASKLFRTGIDDSLKRSVSLMENLVLSRVLQASVDSNSLIDKLCTTIAHLLGVERNLAKSIGKDLVNLCIDLSMIQEGKLFETHDKLRLTLFSETVEGSNHSIAIPSVEALYAIQGAGLKLVLEFALYHRNDRLGANYESSKQWRSADALWRDDYSMTTILSSLRQVLLTPLPKTARERTFAARAQTNALRLMESLATECKRFGAPMYQDEMMLLVARATNSFFCAYRQDATIQKTSAKSLCNLMHDTIVFPPLSIKGGSDTRSMMSIVLPSLLDCIQDMARVLKMSGPETELCCTVLFTIQCLLQQGDGQIELAMHHCAANEIFPQLFGLLGESNLTIRSGARRLLHLFLSLNNHLQSSLTAACRFAVTCSVTELQADMAEAIKKSLTTPNRPSPIVGKRKKRVSISGRSPQKLVFEPSPKRVRVSGAITVTPGSEAATTENLATNHFRSASSLLDSLNSFFSKMSEKSQRMVMLCRQRPLTLEEISNIVPLLRELGSAIALLIPTILHQQNEWIAKAAAVFFETLSAISVIVASHWQGLRDSTKQPVEHLVQQTMELIDIGLMCHVSLLRTNRGSEDSMIEFLTQLSNCAWGAMSSHPAAMVQSQPSWKGCCHQCCFIMRFLNAVENNARPCYCSLASQRQTVENLHIASEWPIEIKIIVFAFAYPPIGSPKTGIAGSEVQRLCQPGVQKCEHILQMLLRQNDMTLFPIAFLALLPSLIPSWTHHLQRNMRESKTRNGQQSGIKEVFWAACTAFYQRLLVKIRTIEELSPEMRKGLMLGIYYFRSLLVVAGQAASPYSDIHSVSQLLLFSFLRTTVSRGLSHPESPHGLSSMDKELRFWILSMSWDADETLSAADRVQKWRIVKEMVLQTSVVDLRSMPNVRPGCDRTLNFPSLLSKLISMPFADDNYSVRLTLSRELGHFLFSGRGHVLQAIVGTSDPWYRRTEVTGETLDLIFAPLCQEIDRLLVNNGDMPRSQLPPTITSPSFQDSINDPESNAVEKQYTALRAIACLCQFARYDEQCGRALIENSLIRLVRVWATFDRFVDTSESELVGPSLSALSFLELRRLAHLGDLSFLKSESCHRHLLPSLICEILEPAVASLVDDRGKTGLRQDLQHRQNRFLYSFFESIILFDFDQKNDTVNASGSCSRLQLMLTNFGSPFLVASFLDDTLRFIIPAMVIEKDYDSMRLITGFKLFVIGLNNSSTRNDHRDNLIGMSIRKKSSSAFGTTRSRPSLEEHTKNLCLQTDMIEHTLPRLLIGNYTDRSQVVFFLEVALQNEISLQKLVAKSDNNVLKGLIWELGGWSRTGRSASQAVEMAALARESGLRGSQDPNIQPANATEIASKWVSSHFMFLLVNIIQKKWREKTMEDKIKALKSLNLMLKFLLPSEAPQFLTQMVATVSMAASQDIEPDTSDFHRAKIWLLRSLAAENLASYCKTLLNGHLEIIGRNLASIVAAMFPVLVQTIDENKEEPELELLRIEAGTIAAGIFEMFTSGQVGKELATYFNEIPFLPTTPLLERTRENLKMNGVVFDNLALLSSSETTQRVLSGRDSMTSDGSSTEKEGVRVNARQLAALQNRLTVVRSLLSHESSGVRLRTLHHLTDLLRANRAVFYQLLEKESSLATILTVHYPSAEQVETKESVTALVETLLKRASAENTKMMKIALATCLGEVAAIDPHRLGGIASSKGWNNQQAPTSPTSKDWHLSQPPWLSSIRSYALHLLTKQLAISLKAAPNAVELHKIAFTIQQMLVALDNWKEVKHGTPSGECPSDFSISLHASDHRTRKQRSMSAWLRDELDRNGVLDILEPYWATSFSEIESKVSKNPKHQPPFFRNADTYFAWLSRWCRYMILRSTEHSTSSWNGIFYACRTAVRSVAGITVSETILPLLVLERLCFGSPADEEILLREIRDVFDMTDCMNFTERQKAVSMTFFLVDTLKVWSERETEGLFKQQNRDTEETNSAATISSGNWNASRCLERIADLLDALSLESMSKSAAATGMHARALLCLELKARASLAAAVYGNAKSGIPSAVDFGTQVSARHGLGLRLFDGIDLQILKNILGRLDDFPTMRAVSGKSSSRLYDNYSIRERESRSDWVGALNDYEGALQSHTDPATRSSLEHAYLNCLLQVGQYESVLNQVNGIIHREGASRASAAEDDITRAIPLGIDAAWRLGRWSILDSLVKEYDSKQQGQQTALDFQLAVGKAMLGLHRRSNEEVQEALDIARYAIMAKLPTFARDSYSRAYPSLVDLHCVREIEDASIVLNSEDSFPVLGLCNVSKIATSSDTGGWAWNYRLDVASNEGSSRIMDVRLALARLAGDLSLEGDTLFVKGRRARKNGLLDVASTCLAQAHAIYAGLSADNSQNYTSVERIGDIQMQFAKLKYQTGHSGSALSILGVEELQGWNTLDQHSLQLEAGTRLQAIMGTSTPRADNRVLQDMAKRLLKSTRWIAEGGLKSVPEVMERFRVVNQLWPKWEKSHFEFGKYVDSILEARISGVAQHEGWSADDDYIRQYALAEDMNCQNYLLMAMEQYLEALKVSDKHVYQALPRLLSLWFEYTSVEREKSQSKRPSKHRRQCDDSPLKASTDPTKFLKNKQDEAHKLVEKSVPCISSSMFYSASPQLISRVCHPNPGTAIMVQSLLTRILTKFPGQAMWELAWVRNSLEKKRSSIGNQIFLSAQKSILGWASNSDRERESKRNILELNRKILSASQSFVKYLIDIAKYTPKDERARSFKLAKWRGEVELCDFIPPVQTALTTPFDTMRQGKDPFPRFRAIHESVQIMSSKAKPKRVKFYVVPVESRSTDVKGVAKRPGDGDIGELHFLLKNEIKGDLRKDARVQDLSNVVNRLLKTSGKCRRQRRLYLRTFAVTCLSEDCGSVEWVPNTEAFRSLVSKSYNPQAATYAAKRRGKRIANFGDPSLKSNFETCQNHFFKNGDLTTAARLFESHFLNAFPPLFYWWFVQTFMDPHAWYEARTNFTTSAAVWSALGHVIGLGDRHSENLLIDTSNGCCVHVDFDCIFDKGLSLPKPEIIPFRLTPNMVDAFGPVGADGMYTESLKAAMSVLRDNRDTLLSVLEPFVKDPIIDWKKNSSSQRQVGDGGIRDKKQAKRSMKVIDERLRGIYNLGNPNLKKIRRTDQTAVDHDEEMALMVPLSVDGQVHKMITEATSHENLIQLYIGWMPWI